MADKIILLEDGELIEFGTHDSLMRLNGVYSKMSEIQATSYLSTTETEPTTDPEFSLN